MKRLDASPTISSFIRSSGAEEMREAINVPYSGDLLGSLSEVQQGYTLALGTNFYQVLNTKEISANQYQNNTNLTGIYLGEGVTGIGSNSFRYCSNLVGGLTIPDSVTSIGSKAFAYCNQLSGPLVIPNSVASIGSYAFYTCGGFTGPLLISDSVTGVGDYAFFQCIGFSGDLTIGNSVTNIGSYAFGYCSNLDGSIIIPNSVTGISNNAFRGSAEIVNVNCYTPKAVLDVTDSIYATSISTIHARASDATWTTGVGQTIGGKTDITVIKDL